VQDEEGAFPVFEAVLVAILILGAIVFVSLTASPSQEESAGGISMGRVASDTLAILQVRSAADDQYSSALEEIIALAMQGNTAQAEGFLREVLPRGTNFEMRLDNGVTPLGLLPYGRTASLRAADGDAVLMVSNWNHAPGSLASTNPYLAPGDALLDADGGPLNLAGCTDLVAPTGSPVGPGEVPWITRWDEWRDGGDWSIPAWAPYGWWAPDGCAVPPFRVVHPGCTVTNHADAETVPLCNVARPVYGVQLLVWDGV
jgi:hypothetical protein